MKALTGHIAKYRARGFNVIAIHIDGESGAKPIKADIETLGIVLNPVGSGDHIPDVERKIRTIKERVRGQLATAPFRACAALIVGLVLWATAVVNAAPAKGGIEGTCPTEAFHDRKIDMKRDFRTGWGAYCETVEPVDASQKNKVDVSRTRPCIALS